MPSLEFKITGDFNFSVNNKKDWYVSLVANIEGWKKNIVFYKKDVGEEVFRFLLQQILENKVVSNWFFSTIAHKIYMNSVFVSQLLWIKDEKGNIIFEEDNHY